MRKRTQLNKAQMQLHELYVKLWNCGGEETQDFKKLQKEIIDFRSKHEKELREKA